jgi:hypothetical protein
MSSIINITFAGLPVSAYQDYEVNTEITAVELPLYSGLTFGAVSTTTRDFPLTYDCYITNLTEYTNLKSRVGAFDTLIIEGVSYTNCYISVLGSRKELIRGSGIYTYKISFSQVDIYQ